MADSHEMRGEVIFKEQHSTRNLIQFSIVLSIKTRNFFPEFSSPVAQAILVTNHCELTFRQCRRLIQFQIQSDVFCSFFFLPYSIDLVAAGTYSTSSVTRDRIIFENRIRSQLQQ